MQEDFSFLISSSAILHLHFNPCEQLETDKKDNWDFTI